HLSFFFAGTCLQKQQFVDHALVGAKSDGIAKESGHGAELAAVGTTSSRLNRDNAERSPAFTNLLQHCLCRVGYKVELVEINRLPGNHGILFERGLALFTSLVDRYINFFQLAASRVVHHLRPGFIGFAQGYSVGVAWPAVAPQGL